MSERYWITKYALSAGIKVVSSLEAEVSENHPSMLAVKGYFAYFHGEGKEWHRSRESALARVEEMRKTKIASLKKQIAKLEKKTFENTPE